MAAFAWQRCDRTEVKSWSRLRSSE